MNPYREPAADPVRHVPAGLRLGEVLGMAAVVTAVGAWVGLVARVVLALPPYTMFVFIGLALATLGLATLVDQRTRASLVNDPELAGSWPIECARRRRKVATNVLVPLVAWMGLGLVLRSALFTALRPF
jgi:hypothetical protein